MTFYTGVEKLVVEFPAYDVYRRDTHPAHLPKRSGWLDVTDISVDDVLILATETNSVTTYHGRYRAGSVVSYSLQNNDDVISAVDDARENGHSLHWINRLTTAVSNRYGKRYQTIEVTVGMRVRFEGVLFTIERAPNDNLKLKRIED